MSLSALKKLFAKFADFKPDNYGNLNYKKSANYHY
jgi:hypothetical protein